MIVCDSHWGDLAYEFMDELKEIVLKTSRTSQ